MLGICKQFCKNYIQYLIKNEVILWNLWWQFHVNFEAIISIAFIIK